VIVEGVQKVRPGVPVREVPFEGQAKREPEPDPGAAVKPAPEPEIKPGIANTAPPAAASE
jgi:hypothetical protein